MNADYQIPEPILFNPFKHHLGFIKEFINQNIDNSELNIQLLSKDIKHLGRQLWTSITGNYRSVISVLRLWNFSKEGTLDMNAYSLWTGTKTDSFKIIKLSDESQWTLKYHDDHQRYIHLFPARNSSHTFR